MADYFHQGFKLNVTSTEINLSHCAYWWEALRGTQWCTSVSFLLKCITWIWPWDWITQSKLGDTFRTWPVLFPGGSDRKDWPAMQETWVPSSPWGHSVRHDWAAKHSTAYAPKTARLAKDLLKLLPQCRGSTALFQFQVCSKVHPWHIHRNPLFLTFFSM